ncbi:MAG TPA: TolC family protein, partial [Desulfobacterales bacterium]|nr:TolC family protein [Desulfobacterales bacterium]
FLKVKKSLQIIRFPQCAIGSFLIFLLVVGSIAQENKATPDIQGKLILNLSQIIDQARSANRNLLQNALLVQNNQYSLQSAESEFDWKVRPVANVGLSNSENSTEQASGISGQISKKNSLGIETAFSPSVAYVNNDGVSSGVGVSLSVPLFRGFGKEFNFDSIYAADFALESSVRNVYLAEVEKIIETVSLAYEIVRQQTLVTLFREQNNRLLKHVVTIEIMEKTGLGNQIDTYRAQIRQKDVQDQLSSAMQKYQISLDRLKVLLALPMDTDLEIDIPLSYELTELEIEEAEQIALDNRLEIEQSTADLVEARRKSRVAEKRILPDLSFVARYRKNAFLEGIDANESYNDDYWSIGFSSDTDISRSAENASYQQSIINVRRMQLKLATKRDTIIAEVKNRLTALSKEAQSIRLRQEQVLQAKGKRRLAEIKFSHGMGGNFDFIESETELQRAKANLLTGKITYIVGQYRLRAALGTLITR